MIRLGILLGWILLLGNYVMAQKIDTVATEQQNVSKKVMQNDKTVVLKLKNGYSVKGVIVTQNEKVIKIRTKTGEVFEYSPDQIESISEEGNQKNKSDRERGTSGIGQKENTVFNKGDKVLNAGLGFGAGFNRHYFGQTNRIPAIVASYEIGTKDELFDKNSALGIGAIGGFTSQWNNEYDYSYSYFFIGVKGSIHYQFVDNLDTYGGLMLGLEFFGVNSSLTNELAQSFLLGGRYYLTDKLGASLELGFGLTAYGSVGIAVKL